VVEEGFDCRINSSRAEEGYGGSRLKEEQGIDDAAR
jgi:hypothetical protein